jgi:hypothetical protein
MRRPIGQVALAFNLMIAIFVVGSLGFVAYEVSRILLAREQLTHCLQLAALGGGAEMASTSSTGAAAQNLSTTVATFILQKNAILGQSLANNVVVVSNPAFMQPQPGQVCISYEFDDPVTKLPSATGNVLRVYGTYAYQLFSGGFGSIGVAVYTVMAEANAGLPALDLEIVYESSSSMDDQTPVTMVRRYWDPTIPAIGYFIPPNSGGPLQQGPLGGLVCSPLIGSAVNGLPPQNLDAVGDPKTTTCPKEFSETGQMGKTVPLRGVTNSSNPPGDAPPAIGGVGIPAMITGPGNTQDSFALKMPKLGPSRSEYWLHYLAAKISNFHLEQPAEAFFTPNGFDPGSGNYNPWGADPTMFTDLVVNINGQNTFASYTGPGAFGAYPFPTLDYLVEASRGNMEGFNPAPSTHPDQAIGNAAQPGYQQAYQLQAYQQLQPKIIFESAIKTFMSKLLQTSDCHFGLVAFNNRAGLSPTDTATAFNVSWAYPVAGKVNYLIPQIPLTPGNNNFAAINNMLTPAPMGGPVGNPAVGGPASAMFVPNGGSNLADGLQQALNNLTSSNSRTGAMKAIVVVTDKVPTRDLKGNIYTNPAANAPALADAMNVATACRAQGIPIFMVTIDQSVNAQMTSFMQTQFSDTAPGGLINTAGSGGVLYINNWTGAPTTYTSLVGSFNNVVRQLMTLVQGGGQVPPSSTITNG